MISLVDSPESQALFFRLCQGSAFGCKLSAAARAYGFGWDFLRAWTDGSAAYLMLDGQLSIAGAPSGPEEALGFIQAAAPISVFSQDGLLQALGLRPRICGAVMEKELSPGPPEAFPPPPLLEACALLSRAGMAVDVNALYPDVSHRLRHGAAIVLGEYANGALAGCALTLLPGREALLSALAVDREHRGHGIGSALVEKTARALPGYKLYLFRESGSNREFYRRLGFRETGRWAQT